MSTGSTTRRRWFQFGLGTILWIVVLAAVAAVVIHEQRERAVLRDEVTTMRAEIADMKQKHSAQTRVIIREIKKREDGSTQPLEPFYKQ